MVNTIAIQLTSSGESVQLNHKVFLVAEDERESTFVIFRCDEDTDSAHPGGVSSVVHRDSESVRRVIEMSESGQNGTTWSEIKTT